MKMILTRTRLVPICHDIPVECAVKLLIFCSLTLGSLTLGRDNFMTEEKTSGISRVKMDQPWSVLALILAGWNPLLIHRLVFSCCARSYINSRVIARFSILAVRRMREHARSFSLSTLRRANANILRLEKPWFFSRRSKFFSESPCIINTFVLSSILHRHVLSLLLAEENRRAPEIPSSHRGFSTNI